MGQKLSRRTARENAFAVAFSATFAQEPVGEVIALSREEGEYELDSFAEKLILDYDAHAEQINGLIEARLKGWTMQRLPRVSLVILRLAVSEMLYGEERLPGVAINEAVELAKKFGGEDDYQFVNGVLGSIVRDLGLKASDLSVQE